MSASDADGRPLVMIGAGGHAKVLHALALAAGRVIAGVCDPKLAEKGVTRWRGVPVLGGDDALERFDPATVGLINGIGQIVRSDLRQLAYLRLRRAGFIFPALVHPSAWVAPTVRLAQGVQIMAGVVIQPDCCVGENSIINTRVSLDHDCEVGAHAHIAPGATLCGGVCVHDGAFVGSGAVVLPGVIVGYGAIVAAGTILTRNLDRGSTLLGAAARTKVRSAS